MRDGDEPRFERAGREVDAALEHAVEETPERRGVAGGCLRVRLDLRRREEEAEHPAHAVDGERYAGFVGGAPIQNQWAGFREAPTQTEESVAMSKALKKRGFNFVGPVIVYAFMQAVGMVNDHEAGCFRHGAVK